MKSGFRWSGRILGSLLSAALAAHIVHAQQQETAEAASLAAVVDGHSFAGQVGGNFQPVFNGAIGPFSYIQMINTSARIYNRNTHAVVATASLDKIAGTGGQTSTGLTTFSVDPQIIWDPSTNRFYYVMRSTLGRFNHVLAFGFSRTSNPTDFSTNNWCNYRGSEGPQLPLDLTLGDSHHFIIIGANFTGPGGHGPRVIAISKPPAGSACPAASSFKIGGSGFLVDTNDVLTWAPVAANQVDGNATGYVVARSGQLPSNKLWFYSITRDPSTGFPVVGTARGLTVPTYDMPPDASQPTVSQRLETGDARLTQAVQARNPNRGTIQSFWVQHTVKHLTADLAAVRWYEIDPAPARPVILRSGLIKNSTSHFYNAAISPDRRSDGATLQFGDSFVIHYNESGSASGISPRIVARSSFDGGPLSAPLIVRNAAGPFQHSSCSTTGSTCSWGGSQASPDPRPTAEGRGQVWGTNMYSGVANPSTSNPNYRTWIFALQP